MIANWLDRHRRSVLLAFALLALCGVASIRLLPVGLFPLVDFPRVVVSLDAGDRPVERMVVEVIRPLEQALRSVPGVKTIRSTSSRGSAEISVSFGWGSDMVVALLQAEAAVNAGLRELPAGIRFDIRRMDPTVFPVLGLAVSSDKRALSKLRDLANFELLPELSSVDGVARVEVLGGQQAEFHVLLDPVRLRALDLTSADVAQSLAASNTITAVGRLEDHYRLYLVLADSHMRELDDIAHTVLRSSERGLVELEDVADVRLAVAPEWTRINADGKDAVLVNILQQRGASTVAITAEVRARLLQLAGRLPADVHIKPYYDQSELIVAAAGSVRDAILIGAVLAGVILMLFLRNLRITLIVSLVLPLVLLASCALLHVLGQSFNIMTLGGMAAAVGLVVDDAVVMLEHIARRLSEDENELSHPQRLLAYAAEMLRPLAGSSAATVAVFIPLAFLGGVAGGFFRPLALTMAATLLVSFLVALLVVPILARALLRRADVAALEHSGPWLRRVHAVSADQLQRSLQRPLRLALPLLLIVLAGGLAYARLGSGFMPRMDEGGFIFDYWAAPGTSLTETDRLLRQVESIVMELPEVESYSRRTGVQLGGGLTEANEGDMFIKLKPFPRRPIEDVMSDLRQRVEAEVPGLRVETLQLMEDLIGDLIANPQPIEVKMFGPDDATLRALAVQVANRIGRIRGLAEVFDGTTIAGDALEIRVDPVRASLEGLTAAAVTDQVQALLAGSVSTQIASNEQMIGVRAWTAENLRARTEQLADLQLRAPDGHYLPLSRVATVANTSGQPQHDRENLRQMVAVTARLDGRDLGSAMQEVQSAVAQMHLPSGYSVAYGGLYQAQRDSFRELLLVFTAALLLVATLLMFLYERVAVVLAILCTVLLTVPGVFLALWLTGTELDLSSMTGMTMVVGIVAEVAIFYFAELDTRAAIGPAQLVHAARMRLRPILMTSSIAILALLPLALGLGAGAQMQRPLAITIIAGLLLAVPLVLICMPLLFLLFDRFGKPNAAAAVA